MADLSAFDNLRGYAGPTESHAALDQMRARAERFAELRDQARELTGTATSDDGYIEATAGAAGLNGLTLEPRAMRLPSVDLAAAIVDLAQRAREDYERQRRELIESAGGIAQPDLDESRAQLEEMQAAFAGGTADLQAVFERFRARFGT